MARRILTVGRTGPAFTSVAQAGGDGASEGESAEGGCSPRTSRNAPGRALFSYPEPDSDAHPHYDDIIWADHEGVRPRESGINGSANGFPANSWSGEFSTPDAAFGGNGASNIEKGAASGAGVSPLQMAYQVAVAELGEEEAEAWRARINAIAAGLLEDYGLA